MIGVPIVELHGRFAVFGEGVSGLSQDGCGQSLCKESKKREERQTRTSRKMWNRVLDSTRFQPFGITCLRARTRSHTCMHTNLQALALHAFSLNACARMRTPTHMHSHACMHTIKPTAYTHTHLVNHILDDQALEQHLAR